jgi:hypothetical protein
VRPAIWAALLLSIASPAQPDTFNPAGLVPLPCNDGPLQPVAQRYCKDRKHFVTPAARTALLRVAEAVRRRHPGAVVRYMEASWPSGLRPMPPHLSHGDGRQVDLVLFYEGRDGRPLAKPAKPYGRHAPGYGAFEPPRREAERACVPDKGHHAAPDPPGSRPWRLHEARTAELVRRLSADQGVRRIFIEPHLKARLGFSDDPKVRFAGCQAARHDDHVHVDFR